MTQDKKTENFSIRLSMPTMKQLRKHCKEDRFSQSDYITDLIEKDTLLRARRRA